MSRISRRHFLAGLGALAGAAAFSGRFVWAARQTPKVSIAEIKSGSDVVPLGRTGIQTSVLGIGTGTHGGRDQYDLGQAAFTKLVRHALDRGITYIDAADAYRTRDMVRPALKGVPRDRYFVQTKTRAKTAEDAKADVDRLRRQLGIDEFDTLLMHAMGQGNWPVDMRPVMDVLHDAKEKGRIKAVGVSCHGLDPLVASAGNDWIDVHLVRINPFEMKMDGTPDQVSAEIKKMHALGHGVLGMKIFGETGYDGPEERLQALRYVLGLGCVHAFTIGFTSTAQIDETLGMIEQAADLNRAERRKAA
jgi:predicted aldo/keto reductase-like oxidoreductase